MTMDLERRRFLAQAALLAGGTLSFGCTRALSQLPEDGPRIPSESLLDPGQRARLVRAVDLILPETDTPGAVAAGVPDFIEMMLVDYYYEDERDRLIEGLDELDDRAQREHAVRFVDATEEAQIEMLRESEREGLQELEASGANPLAAFMGGPPAPPQAFFQSLRELVAVGYTTSAVAAQHVFDFTPFHHGLETCLPLTPSARPSTGGH
jgi:gluconate 2-dehydrogenase gamma chain